MLIRYSLQARRSLRSPSRPLERSSNQSELSSTASSVTFLARSDADKVVRNRWVQSARLAYLSTQGPVAPNLSRESSCSSVRHRSISSSQGILAPVLPSLAMLMTEIAHLVLDELGDEARLDLDNDLDPDAVLMDEGLLDSYLLPSFASALTAKFGVDVPATIVLETGTVRALAAIMLKLLQRKQQSSVSDELTDEPAIISALAAASTLALIGVSGRWPGSCSSVAAAWSVAIASADTVGVVPSQRWVSPESLNEAQSACVKWGGFVFGAENFDAVFFRLSKAEAQAMDPQQRLLLELTYTTLHEGGWRQAELVGSATGIVLGISNTDFG